MSDRYHRIVETLNRRQPDLTLAMENVHKTRNLGALARTCDAVGVGTIHAITDEGSLVSLGHKTAGGTEKWLSVKCHQTVNDAYSSLHREGFRIIAADIGDGTRDFRDVDYTGACALVVGSELDGLSHGAAERADERIYIPLMGMVESLNVSVAAGVILFEAARQRHELGYYSKRRISDQEFTTRLFEWLHPAVASYCRKRNLPYPTINSDGDISESITDNPRRGLRALGEPSN